MTEASTRSPALSEAPVVHGYHAHVYYDTETSGAATRLRETLRASFQAEVGEPRDEPVGPHPISQFAVIFKTEQFQSIVPWLMLNRSGLDILVHPLTDDMVDDHSVYALWLGSPVELKLATLRRRGYGTTLLPAA